jgi:D-serine deaminase-like pyridoxal phosphate-dependent protein
MAHGPGPFTSPTVDWRFKGFPLARGAEIPAGELRGQQWNVLRGDLLLPLMLLKRSALTHNVAAMAEYCRTHGVALAPHAKTSMAPALLHEQLEAGAWGFTVANTSQAIVLRGLGFRRLLLASQMVEPRAIAWAADELRDPEFELLVLVDSVEAVAIMDATLRKEQAVRPLRLLVEFGQWGGRTGCRTPDQVESVIKAIQATDTLELAGIEGFEGLIPAGSPEEILIAVDEYLSSLRAIIERLASEGAFDHLQTIIVSAGGSAYFDLVVQYLTNFDVGRPVQTILRSGCYVTHDHEMYELTSPLAARGDGTTRLQPAFELFGAVWSRPEPTLAVVGMGKRDAPSDYLLPRPLRVIAADGTERPAVGRFRVASLNDQHAYLDVPPEDPLRPGDRVVFGISHPCAAFDKWRLIPVVDDEYNVIDAMETYF